MRKKQEIPPRIQLASPLVQPGDKPDNSALLQVKQEMVIGKDHFCTLHMVPLLTILPPDVMELARIFQKDTIPPVQVVQRQELVKQLECKGSDLPGVSGTLAPLIGGWLAGGLSYPGMFVVAALSGVASLGILHFSVREPRKGMAAP